MTGTTHLTGVPDLKTSLISKPVTLEIREIRVSTVAWEVQPSALVCDGRHSRDYDVFRYKFTYKFPRHSRDYDIFFG